MSIDELKDAVKKVSDNKLIETFSKGALKLTDEQINTVSFVFWLCYMAETDLNAVLLKAWDMAQKVCQFPNQEEVNQVIKDMGIDLDKLEYFSQKISLYEKMFGKIARVKLFWKLNTIRNDLSHNRIDSLTYNGESLMLRATKEKIITDYFETSLNSDFSKSKIWNSLTLEQQKQAGELTKKYLG